MGCTGSSLHGSAADAEAQAAPAEVQPSGDSLEQYIMYALEHLELPLHEDGEPAVADFLIRAMVPASGCRLWLLSCVRRVVRR